MYTSTPWVWKAPINSMGFPAAGKFPTAASAKTVANVFDDSEDELEDPQSLEAVPPRSNVPTVLTRNLSAITILAWK